jgi:hypothetical protein
VSRREREKCVNNGKVLVEYKAKYYTRKEEERREIFLRLRCYKETKSIGEKGGGGGGLMLLARNGCAYFMSCGFDSTS